MPTVLVQLDALRHDYITEQHTPFLFSLKQDKSISGVLKPTYGFEPDAAYIAGLYPDEADGGAQYWYDPEHSPFRLFGKLPGRFDYFPAGTDRYIRKIIELILKKFYAFPVFSTSKIPFHLLPFFSFPMQHRIDHENFVNAQTVFDVLRAHNKNWFLHCYPDNNVDIQALAARVKKRTEAFDFAFFHIGNLDGVGHRYGPGSQNIKTELEQVDKYLQDIFTTLKTRFGELDLVLIGDHGMVEVVSYLNLQAILDKLPLKSGTDYLCFQDSTQARFWFFNERAKAVIAQALQKITRGKILDREALNRYGLNYAHNKFGDLIFIVNPGVLIFPNFYQVKNPVKGMHGYVPESKDQQSAFIIQSAQIANSVVLEKAMDMRLIFPLTLKLLGLPVPPKFQTETILNLL